MPRALARRPRLGGIPMNNTGRIAIIGSHLPTAATAPRPGAGWSVWRCSRARIGAAADVWFELHPRAWVHEVAPVFIDFLKTQPVVFMQQRHDDIPGSKAFPTFGLIERFGPYFFTCQVAWMLAWAITMRPAEIGLWGVEMAMTAEEVRQADCALSLEAAIVIAERCIDGMKQAPSPTVALANTIRGIAKGAGEYAWQRPAVQHFVQVARDLGIKVTAPDNSTILTPARPYRDWPT